jgi:hypothetical protein
VWSSTSWRVIKDVAMTSVGLGLIIGQGAEVISTGTASLSAAWVLGAGVVLTGGVASLRVGKVITARFDGTPSSPPSTLPPSPSALPPSSSPPLELEAGDEH